VEMESGLRRGRYPLGLARAVEMAAVQVALRGVVGRGGVVDPSALLIHALDAVDVERAIGDELRGLAVTGNPVHVAPTVPLRGPQEFLAAIDPGDVPDQVYPGRILLREDRSHRPGGRIRHHDLVRLLRPVHALQGDLVRTGPLHPGEV